MNILLLGSQHGNELLGERLYRHITQNHPALREHVTFKLGNPKARRLKVRYTESDMNRSYNPLLKTYEAQRAKIIKDDITKNNYDLVLDLHTTTCVQPPCLIVAGIHSATLPYLRSSSIRRIVHLRHPIVAGSLIGHVKQAVSIEVFNADMNQDTFEALTQDLRRYIVGSSHDAAASLYQVDELILKSEVAPDVAATFKNFEMSAAGFIPILTGENSYKKNTHYLGFKAEKETVITL